VLALAVAAAALPAPPEHVRFDNEKVIRFSPSNNEQLAVIKHLRTQLTVPLGLDWWLEPSGVVGRHIDVRVPVATLPNVTAILAAAGIEPTTMIENVQTLVDEQFASLSKKAIHAAADFDFTQYHELPEIQAFLATLPREFPDLVTLVTVGESYEGRTIYGVKIASSAGNKTNVAKPGFWFDGGIHAREWISPATVLYMLNELVTGYGVDTEITSLVDSLDIFVVPVFNVDGYEFTYNSNRMWRKTRRPNPGSSCVGTDPNRNFDDHWGEIGASGNPCDETFYGSGPFSEVEVKAVADYLSQNTNIQAYFNFHSYSQMWLSPWGWTDAYPPDYSAQTDLSRQAVTALTAVYGTRYTYGPSSTTIYPTSGGSNDWTYDALGIIHSYVVELRDTGSYGFLLPANQIVPTGTETFEALKVAMKYILTNPAPRRVPTM